LTDGCVVEIRFKDRGLFELVSIVEKVRNRAIAEARERRQEEYLRAYLIDQLCGFWADFEHFSAVYATPEEAPSTSSAPLSTASPLSNDLPPAYE